MKYDTMKKRKKGKNLKIFLIFVVILIITLGTTTIFLIPGLSRSVTSFIKGEEINCANAPYNPNCICTIDRNKVRQGFKYYCVTGSPKATTDCDWCAGNCIEWKKVWEQYGDAISYNQYCDPRTPVPGYACVARVSEFGTMECVSVPSIYTEGLITFCNDEALIEFVQEWQGTDEELVGFFKSGCPVPGKNPYDNCDLSFGGQSGSGSGPNIERLSNVECRSICYDMQGNMIGGQYLWSIMWDADDRSNIIAPGTRSFETDCISGV